MLPLRTISLDPNDRIQFLLSSQDWTDWPVLTHLREEDGANEDTRQPQDEEDRPEDHELHDGPEDQHRHDRAIRAAVDELPRDNGEFGMSCESPVSEINSL